MRKLILPLFVLALLSANVLFAQEAATRTFRPLDRGLLYQFDYPVETHSVRTSNLQLPEDAVVVAGGLVAVEPNDSYIYAAEVEPTYTSRMRILVQPDLAADSELSSLAGTLPLIQYDLQDLTVEETTLGGQPAVRVDGIPLTPGAGTTEIITAYEGLIYEIVIEPVPLGMGFESFDVTLDPVYEGILDSWEFVPLGQ
jgi:hypothetical protein